MNLHINTKKKFFDRTILIVIVLSVSMLLILFSLGKSSDLNQDINIYKSLLQIEIIGDDNFQSLDQVYSLLGNDIETIENKYSIEVDYTSNIDIRLSRCVLVRFSNKIIIEVSVGGDLSPITCFNEENFSKDKRLQLFGKETNEIRYIGLADFGEYIYPEYFISLIKRHNSLFSFWASSTDRFYALYNPQLGNLETSRLNPFLYHPVYDEYGNILQSKPEV